MRSLFLLLAVCQQAVAVNIAPAVMGDSTPNSCPSQEKLETALQRLRNSTRDIISKIRPQCGEGIWYQLVAINMSAADNQCPNGWVEENEGGVRACGRGTVGASCQSVLFNDSHRMEYTKVCGRAIGYQYGHPDAFAIRLNGETIDQNYVDGLSITYGSPRQHLWTFAAAVREGDVPYESINHCPCSSNPGASPPSYVGNNWYCESGNSSSLTAIPLTLWSDDPLWDGKNCEGTCCSNGKTPPWFSVELPAPTNNYIEARVCANEHSNTQEDVFINIFELYIQ